MRLIGIEEIVSKGKNPTNQEKAYAAKQGVELAKSLRLKRDFFHGIRPFVYFDWTQDENYIIVQMDKSRYNRDEVENISNAIPDSIDVNGKSYEIFYVPVESSDGFSAKKRCCGKCQVKC